MGNAGILPFIHAFYSLTQQLSAMHNQVFSLVPQWTNNGGAKRWEPTARTTWPNYRITEDFLEEVMPDKETAGIVGVGQLVEKLNI